MTDLIAACDPATVSALARVVEATRSYFQHHISQAPHRPHAEAVTAALAALDALEKTE